MIEVFWLITDKLGGRPGPNRAPWDLAALRDAGIGAVLSVNDGLLCHPEDFASAAIRYACIPLSDNAPPQPGDVEMCLRALPEAHAFVTEQLANDRRTIVHCSSGKDRTGLYLAYHWMQETGASAEVAIEHVKRVRPIAFSAWGWDEHALDVLRRCSGCRPVSRETDSIGK
jgi:protein-tyrosine phosphatase